MAEETEVKQPEVKEPSEREKLYQQYTETPPAEEKKEEVTEQPPVEAEKKEEPKEEKKEEPKHEPHDWKAATYEEREKRKIEARLRKEAEERATALQEKIKRYESQQTTEEPITDYDREIQTLRNKIRAIEETEQERGEREKREHFERAQQQTRSNIEQAHKDLLSEGLPGFKHSIGAITDELRRLVAEDESNTSLDNPAGWKKIYREKIYPDLQREFEESQRKRADEEKKSLKEKANLVSAPGSKPVEKKKDAEVSNDQLKEDYIRMRRGV